jgi:DNA modification methylase
MTVVTLIGGWTDQLRTLPPQSVHCVTTSPPYWGLRDYGVAGQLGLEKDPNEYIAKVVAGFGEVRRVLRNDGTLWLNMGDSYTDGGRGDDTGSNLLGARHNQQESRKATNRKNARPFGLGTKQLIGMPWRIALALQADGWYLRSDIIWAKPNPMPESTRDRPTKAHEYLFLFSKRARYFYDADAIAEPVSGTAHHRGYDGVGRKAKEKIPSGWATGTDRSHQELTGRFSADREEMRAERPHSRMRITKGKSNESFLSATRELVATRNKRDVWIIRPEGFKGAHFATFPQALVRPCILAGTSPKACELCGAPWRPIYGTLDVAGRGFGNKERKYRQDRGGPASSTKRQGHAVPWTPQAREILDYKRSCNCSLATGSGKCVVLDPFGGAGTTALVAEQLGRDSILIELNPEYVALSDARRIPTSKESA